MRLETGDCDHAFVSTDGVLNVVHVVVNEAYVIEYIGLFVLGELVRIVEVVQIAQGPLIVLGINLFLGRLDAIINFLTDGLRLLGLPGLRASFGFIFIVLCQCRPGHQKTTEQAYTDFKR